MQRRDVRKKKHPELQPYVPSDRFTYVRPNKVVSGPKKEQTKKKPINTLPSDPKKVNSTLIMPAKTTTTGPSQTLSIATKENTCTISSTTTTIQSRRSSYTKSTPNDSYSKQPNEYLESSPISRSELSELSNNELHYESAASDIIEQQLYVQPDDVEPRIRESVISTNGNTTTTSTLYDKTRNLESLCNEFEADLIAEGLMKVDDRERNMTNSVKEDDQQNYMQR